MNFTPLYQIATRVLRRYQSFLGISTLGARAIILVVYVVKKFSLTETYSPEIEKIGWFDYTALPETTSPGTKRRLQEYFTNQTPSETW